MQIIFSQDQINFIINSFPDLSINSIAKSLNVSPPVISRFLKSQNIPIKNNHSYDHLRSIPLSQFQLDFLIGHILGDGSIIKDSTFPRIAFNHKIQHKEYFDHKISIMQPFVQKTRTSIDKRGNSTMLQASSISHPDFSPLLSLFYDQNKIIKPDLINFLTPISLAFWAMDDGNLKYNVNFRLATHSFSLEENTLLKDMLAKFNLYPNVRSHSKYFYLYFDKVNTIKLKSIVEPYIIPSMNYKFDIKK